MIRANFHAWLNKLTWCLMQNKEKHFKRPCLSLKFESLIQICSNPSVLSCISPIHSFCHVSCMHHIVAYCHVMIVFCGVFRGRFCLRGYFRVSNWRAVPYYYSIRQAAPLIISIQSHVLASALIYCIKTTTFQTTVCCGSWTLILCMTCHCHSN